MVHTYSSVLSCLSILRAIQISDHCSFQKFKLGVQLVFLTLLQSVMKIKFCRGLGLRNTFVSQPSREWVICHGFYFTAPRTKTLPSISMEVGTRSWRRPCGPPWHRFSFSSAPSPPTGFSSTWLPMARWVFPGHLALCVCRVPVLWDDLSPVWLFLGRAGTNVRSVQTRGMPPPHLARRNDVFMGFT